MARLSKDVVLKDTAFETASTKLEALVTRSQTLYTDFSKLYKDLLTALDCESGKELELAGEDVVLKPIENLELVITQIYTTLTTIKGDGFYHEIFKDFEELQKGL
ncbi:hypothetical protein [uncultured Ruminococcus sp.]|uniref:hypothetical protein n=1 Tax=uncultured Ruminococcus sp. TaxID=165186 RepID=UPI0025D7284B|nr:hypothetical protein [uncultured Ruminococcus sp.]